MHDAIANIIFEAMASAGLHPIREKVSAEWARWYKADKKKKDARGKAVVPRDSHVGPAPPVNNEKELEKQALEDDYFVDKKLFPNVDFYSGIILSSIGFPTTMFTALFALARTVGWVAQWNEMISDPGQVIGRPRQLYTGPTQRDYVPVDKR